MRRTLRVVRRVVLGVLAFVVVVIGAILIAIHTDWGRNIVREHVVTTLAGAFPGGAKIGRIDGSVFGTVTVSGIELDDPDGKPAVTIGTAKIRVGITPLLSRTIRIDSLELDDVAVVQRSKPAAAPEPAAPAETEPSAWSIEVGHVEVHRASALIVNPSRTLDLHDIELYGGASVEHGAITAVVGAHGKWADRAVAATATVYYDRGVLVAPFAAAKVGIAHARVMGLRLGDAIEGVVGAFVPAVTAEAVAQMHLPGDIAVTIGANADGSLELNGSVGDATLRVLAQTSIKTKSASAFVIAEVPDGARLDPRLAGKAFVTAALEGNVDHIRGMVAIDGTRPMAKQLLGQDEIRGTALLAVDVALDALTPRTAWVMLESGLDVGGTRATAIAELARDKAGAVAITSSKLVATASKIGAANSDAGLGYLVVTASASGPVLPKPALKVTGMLDGDKLRYGKFGVASVDARFDTRHLSDANIHLDVDGVHSGPTLLGSASLDARASRDPDGTIELLIDKHSVTSSYGAWSGAGGRVRIEPAHIVIDNLHTASGTGTIVANAVLDRETADLRATIDAKDVALATIAPAAQGTIGATLAVERRGTTWKGTGEVHGRAIVVHGRSPTDVDVALSLAGRHVELATTATAPEGKATVALDLDGPYDITDAAAWKRLERKSLHDATIAIDHLDLGKLGAPSGTIAGKLEITGTGASGDLALRGMTTKHGVIDADISLGPDTRGPLGLLATIGARLENVDAVTAVAQLELPARPFDPAQWKLLGKNALHHATVTLAPLDFDPAVLARAHLDQPYHGHLETKVEISEGAGSATASIDVTKVSGGAIVKPVDVHLQADVDSRGLHVTGSTASGKQELVALDVALPITIDRLAQLETLPLSGAIAVNHVPAEQIVAVLGRRDVTSGVIDGVIELGGTLKRPTAVAAIDAAGITIPASIGGRPPSKLQRMQIAASWDGATGELAISGKESAGGSLAIAAGGRPDQLKAFTATVSATKFDIAPFAAFAVGAFSAARGTIDAELALKGLDPTTGDVQGHLEVHGGRLPISPLLGTLRSTEAHVVIANHEVKADVTAKLGKGDLNGTATVTLDGSTPSKATANLELHDISLVRAFQPTINAKLVATFTHGHEWTGNVEVQHGRVLIATTGGVALLPADAPAEISFTDQAPTKLLPLLQRPPPSKPWLIATVDLQNTGVEVVQDEFQIRGNVGGKLKVSLGDGIGMDGTLEATTQNIELLGARSELDHANVTWDGTLDPMLDVSMLRELTDLTITANISGRLSKPRIDLSSDSGVAYTQGELIGYFLGGTPSADRNDVSQAAAAASAGAASSYLSAKVGKTLHLPKLSLNYEVATASSSEAVKVGYWISKHVFVAVHKYLEPLPDENANEGVGEWHFRNNMMLQGNAGDRGIASLDLIRRWRW